MPLRQVIARAEEQQYELFRRTTRELGITPVDALRMFIYAFNSHRDFPYKVRSLQPVDIEPFTGEADATRFAMTLSLEAINAQRRDLDFT